MTTMMPVMVSILLTLCCSVDDAGGAAGGGGGDDDVASGEVNMHVLLTMNEDGDEEARVHVCV